MIWRIRYRAYALIRDAALAVICPPDLRAAIRYADERQAEQLERALM